jgi:CDP-diacylglycerol--glycerol-3-phosphate 3-phosphatidyltransferase
MLLPNQLTVLRIILTPVFVVMYVSEDPTVKQISLGIYIIAAVTDWYDGWLARKFDYITNWGKFLDPLADKILTSAAFLVFVYLDVLALWMVVLIIIRDFLITGLRLYADYQNIGFTTIRIAKWKTFFQMAFIYYLLAVFTARTIPSLYQNYEEIFASLTDAYAINLVMLFVTVYTVFTGVIYLQKNKFLIKKLFTFENKLS